MAVGTVVNATMADGSSLDISVLESISERTFTTLRYGVSDIGKVVLKHGKIPLGEEMIQRENGALCRIRLKFPHEKFNFPVANYIDNTSYGLVFLELEGSVDTLELKYPEKLNKPLILYRSLELIEKAHHTQVTHADLNKGNILLDSNGEVYLSDFGISTFPGYSKFTNIKPGFVTGTAGYISGRQLRGDEPDTTSDYESYALLTHDFLTGRFPQTGSNSSEITIATVKRDFKNFMADELAGKYGERFTNSLYDLLHCSEPYSAFSEVKLALHELI